MELLKVELTSTNIKKLFGKKQMLKLSNDLILQVKQVFKLKIPYCKRLQHIENFFKK